MQHWSDHLDFLRGLKAAGVKGFGSNWADLTCLEMGRLPEGRFQALYGG
jgi:hypothetical protein